MAYRMDGRAPMNSGGRKASVTTDPNLRINTVVRKWQSGGKLTEEEKQFLIKSGQATKRDFGG